MAVISKIVADFETQLASQIDIGGTSGTLSSNVDDDGVTLVNGTYFLTVDSGNSQKEYYRCTLTGTAISAIQSVSRQGVYSTGSVRKHRVGATVSITDFANIKIVGDLLSGATSFDGTTPLSYDIAPTFTDSKQWVTKGYVDGVVVAGAPDAGASTKGITKLSTAAVSPTNPIAVGDNDTRVPTQDENDALAGTGGAPSTSNKFITEDGTVITPIAGKVPKLDSNGQIPIAINDRRGGYYISPISLALTSSGSAQQFTFTHSIGFIPKKIRIFGIPEFLDSTSKGPTQVGEGIARVNSDGTIAVYSTYVLTDNASQDLELQTFTDRIFYWGGFRPRIFTVTSVTTTQFTITITPGINPAAQTFVFNCEVEY